MNKLVTPKMIEEKNTYVYLPHGFYDLTFGSLVRETTIVLAHVLRLYIVVHESMLENVLHILALNM